MRHLLALLNFCIFLIAVVQCGCVSIPAPDSLATTKKSELPQYWLTTSLYAGAFYDDDKLNLVDYRPLSVIDDATNFDGSTLFPKKARSIIPAGTLLEILKIDYPDTKATIKRPLLSPKDNILIYLRVGKERGRVTVFFDKPHVLVIPQKISDQQLSGYLKRFFSQKDPNGWLLAQESHLQSGILEKRPVMGMKRQHLVSALGPALKKQFQKAGDFEDAQEIWHYHDYLVTIIDDVVAKISPLQRRSS